MNTQTSLVAEQVRLKQWAEQIKECQPDSDKPLNVQSSTKDGVKECDNVKQLIKQTQSNGR